MFTVLVVEDDQPLSRLFGTILGRNGYNAHTVCTASAALHCLEQEYVDLIITDVMLPDMDGFELIRQLRESGSTLPILLVTARETLADKERGFTAGADDYMVKPVEVEELLLRVRALLRRARMISQRKLTVGTTRLDYDTLPSPRTARRRSCPRRNASCSISCSPIRGTSIPGSSSWTRSGGWRANRNCARWMCISTACGSVCAGTRM